MFIAFHARFRRNAGGQSPRAIFLTVLHCFSGSDFEGQQTILEAFHGDVGQHVVLQAAFHFLAIEADVIAFLELLLGEVGGRDAELHEPFLAFGHGLPSVVQPRRLLHLQRLERNSLVVNHGPIVVKCEVGHEDDALNHLGHQSESFQFAFQCVQLRGDSA